MKIPECDHDFEECEIVNNYGYNFDRIKPPVSNKRFRPYYCKKCGMLILKRVVYNAQEIEKFLWEE